MSDLADFNDQAHKTASASVLVQKGIYHLFVLKGDRDPDLFARVHRMYQCLYQLCSAMFLLDPHASVNPHVRQVQGLLKRMGADPKKPSRDKVDPSVALTHSDFGKGAWEGFPAGLPLHQASVTATALINRIVDPRHTVTYRPMLLEREGWYWEDCSLKRDVDGLPDAAEVERVCRDSCAALADEFLSQYKEQQRLFGEIEAGHIKLDELATIRNFWAIEFFGEILQEYEDTKHGRPTETMVVSYARLFQDNSAESAKFLRELAAFQDELLNLCQVRAALSLSAAPAATG